MKQRRRLTNIVPGLRAPAFFCAAIALALSHAVPAQVPVTGQARPPASVQPVPAELELAKLVWTTMAMVDHANRAGNYSVLRDTSASGFQIQNDPSRLAEIFAPIRASRVDVGNALVVAPTYTAAPALLQADVFQVKGFFPLRPTAILFDLYFQWEQGRWKLFGITIEPGTVLQAGQAAAPQPATPQATRKRN